jgi:hypothetical protein
MALSKEDKGEIKELVEGFIKEFITGEKFLKFVEREEVRDLREKLDQTQKDFQKFRDDVLMKQIDGLQRELGKDTMSRKMKDKIEDILMKGFDKAVKTTSGEKSGAEMASDLIAETIDKLKEPILRPLAESVGKQIEAESEPRKKIRELIDQMQVIQLIQMLGSLQKDDC